VRYKKIYGESKINKCIFCDKYAVTKNIQNIPVCVNHKNSKLNDFKCSCGSYLDLKNGKFGVFFVCINCGIINLQKALSFNVVWDENNIPSVEDL